VNAAFFTVNKLLTIVFFIGTLVDTVGMGGAS
jgi:hypothetical protein